MVNATISKRRRKHPILPPLSELDKPRTYKDAAAHLGVGYHVVQRAARRGLVQSYRLGSSRRYVKLRDFIELMTREANG
jgi:hypothetical protein